MRHTFISMFVAKFRSIGEASLQAGNSESIIRKHYLDLKTTEEAELFFGILPRHLVEPATMGVGIHDAVAIPPVMVAGADEQPAGKIPEPVPHPLGLGAQGGFRGAEHVQQIARQTNGIVSSGLRRHPLEPVGAEMQVGNVQEFHGDGS